MPAVFVVSLLLSVFATKELEAVAVLVRYRRVEMKESSDWVDRMEEVEEERVKEGRGLLFDGCWVRKDAGAGLNDRLAMVLGWRDNWTHRSHMRTGLASFVSFTKVGDSER